ncbi:hypothetical protein TNCV_4293551 [Trichonephila clavipes]|uniref:Uncharacterized protein n=1 Tax=Trichonephila clavipes TaxID=2585209 RepID=A0A8X6RGQ7_TRICX|nr:hypothetical protein TNCV_4293551 [Trichonephila clavipes]
MVSSPPSNVECENSPCGQKTQLDKGWKFFFPSGGLERKAFGLWKATQGLLATSLVITKLEMTSHSFSELPHHPNGWTMSLQPLYTARDVLRLFEALGSYAN